jgi:hypothetical protein
MANDIDEWEQYAVDNLVTEERPDKSKSSLVENLKNLVQTGSDVGSAIAQGLTQGYSDELGAAMEVVPQYVPNTSIPVEDLMLNQEPEVIDPKALIQRYRDARDRRRQEYAAAKERTPAGTTVGEIGGAMTSGALMAGAGAVPLMAGGALSALGASEADLTKGEIGQAAADTATGAGAGLLLGKLGQVAIGGKQIPKAATTAVRTGAGALAGAALSEPESRVEGAFLGAGASYLAPIVSSKIVNSLAKTKMGKSIALGVEQGLKGMGITGEEAAARADSEIESAANEMFEALKAEKGEVGQEIGKIRKELADIGVSFNDDTSLIDLMKNIQTAPLSANDQSKADKVVNKLLSIIGEKTPVAPEAVIPSATSTLRQAGTGEGGTLLGKILGEAQENISRRENEAATKAWQGLGEELGTQKSKYSAIIEGMEPLADDGALSKKGIDFVEGMSSPTKSSERASINEFRKKFSNILGEQKATPMLERAEKASQLGELSKSYTKDPELAFTGKLYGIAKTTPANIANIGAQAYKELNPQALAKKALALPPESITQLVSKINSKIPGAEAITKRITEGLTQGDAVKRNAAIFMLMQNPEYRNTINEYLNETGNTEED